METDQNESWIGIPNHATARLSALDMQIVHSVPPGGNWKNVPPSIPSKRLQTIRDSYAAGEGSRSTYYGRLRPDRPAYTINTYFTRPGNGCHIHYDFEGGQHRVLSYREAARLQSFPDSFKFYGSNRSVAMQIGNAVPPLLAFQIASMLGKPGAFVELFSGAGGLGLGFHWAGWKPIVANDIQPSFLETYSANFPVPTIEGDIRNAAIADQLVNLGRAARKTNHPLWVLGGPPCQGFSTAGKRRTMEDDRNLLFWNYKSIIDRLQPDGFVFENVSGLLNMEGGRVYSVIREALSESIPFVSGWVLGTEEYAIPQRRTRVILIGNRVGNVAAPSPRTSLKRSNDLFTNFAVAVSAAEALSDLPPLGQGENGSAKFYLTAPRTAYQRLIRGRISPSEFLRERAPLASER